MIIMQVLILITVLVFYESNTIKIIVVKVIEVDLA